MKYKFLDGNSEDITMQVNNLIEQGWDVTEQTFWPMRSDEVYKESGYNPISLVNELPIWAVVLIHHGE